MACSSRKFEVVLLIVVFAGISAAQVPNIAYTALSNCQQTRFETLPNSPPGQKTWDSVLDDSQRLEYAGGTQALNMVSIQFPVCKGLGEVSSVRAIWGSRPNHPSEDQFNVE